MKLSTKGRYGVRLMLDIAEHAAAGPVTLKEISGRQNISEKYLWQMIRQLKNAGLVNSSRGSIGGYTLTKRPSEITLKDIVSQLEGPICIVDCGAAMHKCGMAADCITRQVWSEISEKLAGIFESYTIEDLLDKKKRMSAALIYNI